MISDLPIIFACALIFLIMMFKAFSNRGAGTPQKNEANAKLGMTELAHWPSGSPWIHRGIRSAHNSSTNLEEYPEWIYNWRITMPQRTFRQRTPEALRLKPTGSEKATARIFLENWRKSIVGLVRLADKNLNLAKTHLEAKNYEAAGQAAFTSTENIARALIHCCGGKPDPKPGQEEALRMLTRRFEAEEKDEFIKAIDIIAELTDSKVPLGKPAPCLLIESKSKQTLRSASEVVALFKRIIATRFGEELQELLPHLICFEDRRA